MGNYSYDLKEGEISIVDFFDPHNKEHILEYDHLSQTGTWRKGFIPKNVIMTLNWHINLAIKMCNTWVEHMKKE